MSSIRGKIMFGYYALAAGVVIFSLFAYADLRFLERNIVEGAEVSAFQEKALEMRRHEKNFFLYHSMSDLELADELANSLLKRIDERAEIFSPILSTAEKRSLQQDLERYRYLIEQYRSQHNSINLASQTRAEEIRATGHAISNRAEAIAAHERRALAATVQQSQRALFISVGLVALLGVIGGQILSRIVVRPLRRLEQNMKNFAAEPFHELPDASNDREIVSFTHALNRMLDEVKTSQRQILQSEKLASLGVLASGVAHEINNPLGNISSSCQILLEEEAEMDGPARREWLTQIDSETERARQIVLTLLEYTRRRTFSTEPVLLRSILEKTLLLTRRQLPRADAVQLEIPPDMMVCADAQRLQQVFINLIKNAVDAAGQEAQVVIRARAATRQDWPPPHGAHVVGNPETCVRTDHPAALITVEDNGPGIPCETMCQVFDPFFTTRDPGHGMGLGLYIVEEIVQEHNGCIAVENRPEGGVRFTIWLPCGNGESPE